MDATVFSDKATLLIIATDRRERGNLLKWDDLATARLPARFPANNQILGPHLTSFFGLNLVYMLFGTHSRAAVTHFRRPGQGRAEGLPQIKGL